jgi:hypothetical protein
MPSRAFLVADCILELAKICSRILITKATYMHIQSYRWRSHIHIYIYQSNITQKCIVLTKSISSNTKSINQLLHKAYQFIDQFLSNEILPLDR